MATVEARASDAGRASAVRRSFRRRLVAILVGIDAVGASVAVLVLLYVVPLPPEVHRPEVAGGTAALATAYAVAGSYVGVRSGLRILAPVADWMVRGGPSGEAVQRRVLEAPRLFTRTTAWLWLGGAMVAFAYDAQFGMLLGIAVGAGIALAGVVASALTLLVGERALRPVACVALADPAPRRRLSGALSKRLVVLWLLTSGSGTMLIALVTALALARPSLTTLDGLAGTTLVLSAVSMGTGLVATALSARATAEPVEELIEGLQEIEDGHLGARVRIWDSTELGALQAGFNAMAAGLEERARIRELFGRHVGEGVAEAALLEQASFDGEVRRVAVLFVDLVGSTSMAETAAPGDLIAQLNAFFGIVVDVVDAHGGWVNKFQGDAALAVWGAPQDVARRDAQCLRAARVLRQRLADELPGLSAGIGVSGGLVVTGNVGGPRRYEYTVVGDPVNEAARLTDLAKSLPSGVAVKAELLAGLPPEERDRWAGVGEVVVRGRSCATSVATVAPPVPSGDAIDHVP